MSSFIVDNQYRPEQGCLIGIVTDDPDEIDRIIYGMLDAELIDQEALDHLEAELQRLEEELSGS